MARFHPSEMVSSFNGIVEKVKSDTFLSPEASKKKDLILSNLDSIKDILFQFRYPKIAILGDSKLSRGEILATFLKIEITRNETLLGQNWYAFDQIKTADFRIEERSVDKDTPDFILCVVTKNLKSSELEKIVLEVAAFQEEVEDEIDAPVEALFLIEEKESSRHFYKTRRRLLQVWRKYELEKSAIFPLGKGRKISEEILRISPTQTRLSLVRVLEDDEVRNRHIDSIIQLATATNSTIASVPLPVADLIPITTVQTLLVVSIAYARGRNLDAKMISAFLGSLGINVSVGFAMREIVRALSQFIPIAGPFVSATIAASTTATLGKKASKYFDI